MLLLLLLKNDIIKNMLYAKKQVEKIFTPVVLFCAGFSLRKHLVRVHPFL